MSLEPFLDVVWTIRFQIISLYFVLFYSEIWTDMQSTWRHWVWMSSVMEPHLKNTDKENAKIMQQSKKQRERREWEKEKWFTHETSLINRTCDTGMQWTETCALKIVFLCSLIEAKGCYAPSQQHWMIPILQLKAKWTAGERTKGGREKWKAEDDEERGG